VLLIVGTSILLPAIAGGPRATWARRVVRWLGIGCLVAAVGLFLMLPTGVQLEQRDCLSPVEVLARNLRGAANAAPQSAACSEFVGDVISGGLVVAILAAGGMVLVWVSRRRPARAT
jgi:hypothetical protein